MIPVAITEVAAAAVAIEECDDSTKDRLSESSLRVVSLSE